MTTNKALKEAYAALEKQMAIHYPQFYEVKELHADAPGIVNGYKRYCELKEARDIIGGMISQKKMELAA